MAANEPFGRSAFELDVRRDILVWTKPLLMIPTGGPNMYIIADGPGEYLTILRRFRRTGCITRWYSDP